MNEPLRVRVLTFNIHGGRPRVGPINLGETARVIAEAEADLAALQEVWRLPGPFHGRNQPWLLARRIGIPVRFLPSFGVTGIGFGNAIASRRPPVSLLRHRLPGGGEPRAVQEALFAHGERSFHLLNTHLSLRHADRMKQVTALANRVRNLDGPIILAGDLNCEVGGEETLLLEEAGLTFCGGPDHCTFPAGEPRHLLDHIAVTSHFELISCRAVECLASDHLPLVADLILWPPQERQQGAREPHSGGFGRV